MRRLKTFLVKYPIGGKLLNGPNAANLASQIGLDYLTGFPEAKYCEAWVKERMARMTPDDTGEVERVCKSEAASLWIVVN